MCACVEQKCATIFGKSLSVSFLFTRTLLIIVFLLLLLLLLPVSALDRGHRLLAGSGPVPFLHPSVQ